MDSGKGRNLEHTTERYQRGFKVPMETGSLSFIPVAVAVAVCQWQWQPLTIFPSPWWFLCAAHF